MLVKAKTSTFLTPHRWNQEKPVHKSWVFPVHKNWRRFIQRVSDDDDDDDDDDGDDGDVYSWHLWGWFLD